MSALELVPGKLHYDDIIHELTEQMQIASQ